MTVDDELITCTTPSEAEDCILHLLRAARYRVDLQSPMLDPALYDKTDVIDAFRQVVVSGGRRSRIRILITDTNAVIQRGHRLLELARQLSSAMEIRELSPEDSSDDGACLLVDDDAYLRWEPGAGYQGAGRRHARGNTARRRRRFDTCWDRAHTPTDLRRLHM